jgi:hypothetical protein
MFICRDGRKSLERKADTEFVSIGEEGKEAVVISFPTAEAMASGIERHPWNQCESDGREVRKGLADRFENAIGTFPERSGRGVMAYLHLCIADDHREQYLLSLGMKAADEGVGIDLIGQRIVEQYGSGRPQTGVSQDAPDEGGRLADQFFVCKLLLERADITAEFLLRDLLQSLSRGERRACPEPIRRKWSVRRRAGCRWT